MNTKLKSLCLRGVVSASFALLLLGAVPAQSQDHPRYSSLAAAPRSAAIAPASYVGGGPGERILLPHNWLRGYTDFSFAPPHNEPDLGRCSQARSIILAAGGANSVCNAYARYLGGGYVEVQPFGRTFMRHAFFFWRSTFSFGNNVPQFKYTASMAPIAHERSIGLGIELPKNFELRLTQHQVNWLGRYNQNVGPADMNMPGPYGLHTTVGARWYFGDYRRARDEN